jgi:hypothetical protein
MGKTSSRARTAALALLAIGIMAIPATAAIGQPGLRSTNETGHLVLVAKKKKNPSETRGQKIDKQITQSGYKQQIQQYMGQDNYQQMIGGQGIPGR